MQAEYMRRFCLKLQHQGGSELSRMVGKPSLSTKRIFSRLHLK